MNRPENR